MFHAIRLAMSLGSHHMRYICRRQLYAFSVGVDYHAWFLWPNISCWSNLQGSFEVDGKPVPAWGALYVATAVLDAAMLNQAWRQSPSHHDYPFLWGGEYSSTCLPSLAASPYWGGMEISQTCMSLVQAGDEAALNHDAKKQLTTQLTTHPAAKSVPSVNGTAEAFRRYASCAIAGPDSQKHSRNVHEIELTLVVQLVGRRCCIGRLATQLLKNGTLSRAGVWILLLPFNTDPAGCGYLGSVKLTALSYCNRRTA